MKLSRDLLNCVCTDISNLKSSALGTPIDGAHYWICTGRALGDYHTLIGSSEYLDRE